MRAAKMRTLLTILGIVIGIAAVTVVMSAGKSAQDMILGQIRGVGSNLVGVLPGASDENGPPAQAYGVVDKTLTNADLEALRNTAAVPHVVAAAGYVTGSASMVAAGRTVTGTYQGVSPDLIRVENITVAAGRFLDADDDARMARVAVLGSEVARDLFGTTDPLERTLDIGGHTFRVIGVLAARGATVFNNPDTTVFVPLLTAQNKMLGISHLNFLRAKVDDEANIAATKEDIRVLLRQRHHLDRGEEDNFSVRDLASAIVTIGNVTGAIRIFLEVVAAVSLVVGGIGVMNVMFIVLSQRIREIGLRKALGATRGDILQQFVLESVAIATIGGVVGIIAGVVITVLIAWGVRLADYDWMLTITWDAIALAFGISVAIGVVFGAYPAHKASRVSPMEALRYE